MTAAHSGKPDLSDLEPQVREIFTRSPLSKDPQRLNVFMFVLDSRAEVIHEFHGLPAARRTMAPGRSDHQAEIKKALKLLDLSDFSPNPSSSKLTGLPDLAGSSADIPAGVRLFIRQDDPGNTHFSPVPVVEVVPMHDDEWAPLSFPDIGAEIEADILRRWLVWLYPAGIRAADEQKRYQRFSGTLKLEPAGKDDRSRYAVLRGQLRLAKGDETQSAFEGDFQAVLTYTLDSPDVRSLRAVVEGSYLYRLRGASPQKLRVAIESRPR